MPCGGTRALGDPPQPEQPDHVVDPDAARVPKDGAHHLAVGRVRLVGQPVRAPGGLAPVLPVLVVRVRRRPHRDALGVGVPEGPGVGPVRVHADREVVHDPQAHAGLLAGHLGGGQLLVQHPLQPADEVDLVGVQGAELPDRGRRRMLQLDGPVGEVRAVVLTQHGPLGEPLQSLAGPPAERGERQPAPRRTRHAVDDPQRLPLGGPGRVPLDGLPGLGGLQTGPERGDGGALTVVQSDRLGDPLRSDVEGVEEAPGARQVRRRLHRRHRLGGVQRVDQDVVRAVLPGGPHGQVGEVGQVTDPPGLPRPDAVELGRQAPGPALPQPGGKTEPGRRDDQRHGRFRTAAAGPDRVVAQRQVGRDLEAGLADPPTVQLAGRGPVLQLPQPAPGAGLQLHPDVDRVAVGDVHRDDVRLPLPGRHAARQHPGPRFAVMGGQGLPGPLRGRGVDVESGQHRDHGLGGHADVVPLPVPVLRRDPVRLRQLEQRLTWFGHADILPQVEPPPEFRPRLRQSQPDLPLMRRVGAVSARSG